MEARELSHQLRHGNSRFLNRRRAVVGLSMVTMGSMGLITLYQVGIIKHLPEPPLPRLDADKVDAAGEAYARFATPDAVLGLASYAGTTLLAAIGGIERAERQPWMPLALAVKVLIDAGQAGILTVDQWTKHRAFCFWCLLAAAATFAQLPLVLPEARTALDQVVRRGTIAHLPD